MELHDVGSVLLTHEDPAQQKAAVISPEEAHMISPEEVHVISPEEVQ